MGWYRGSGWSGARQQGWTLGQSTASLSVANLFAISLAPANTMAATLSALPFVPDLIVDKDRTAASPWSYRSTGIGSGKTVTSDSTNGTAIPTARAGYSGTDNFVAYGIKKHSRFFNEVVFVTDGSGSATFSHGLDPSVSVGIAEFKSTTAVAPWRTYARGIGGSQYLLLNDTAGQAAASNWFTSTSSQITVTGLAASATYFAHLYAHDTASDGVIQSGSFTADSSGNVSVSLPWLSQYVLTKYSSTTGNWGIYDTARGWSNTQDLLLLPNTTAVEAENGATGIRFYPTPSGLIGAGYFSPSSVSIYLVIRAVGG